MPLVRFELGNEYGMGDPELFRAAARREEPKAIMEGVAVAGLVGILRQLGDLAEFAAEIFHDLHEQVTATASRGRKMILRMRQVEEALSSVEKAVYEQKSHIHFAYTSGSTWHPSIRVDYEHLRHTDLPRFIMDSYEGCRDLPKFFLLDRFDRAGPGSNACLRRYSDPSFFKRASSSVQSMKIPKNQKTKKDHIKKKKGSRSSSMRDQHHSIAGETSSTSEIRFKSELGSRSTSFNSRARPSFLEEPIPDITFSKESKGEEDEQNNHNDHEGYPDGDDDYYDDYLNAQEAMGSISAVADLTVEAVKPKPKSRNLVNSALNFDYSVQSEDSGCSNSADKEIPILSSVIPEDNTPKESIIWYEKEKLDNMDIKNQECLNLGEITSEADNYVDASNTLDSESEIEPEIQTKRELTCPLTKPTHVDVDDNTKPSISDDDDDDDDDDNDDDDVDRLRDEHGKDDVHAFSVSGSLKEPEICNQPVTIWTNGGLLGLQPSKPPDFGVNNTKPGNSPPKPPMTSLLTGQTWGPQDEEYTNDAVERLEDDRSTWQESSPPLEHMKMSSFPMNGPDSSKLRLKFPGNQAHESVEELMFPSFQLLPGSTLPVNGSCSDSDDDTFCRSFAYSTEDSCSQHSESNSELWAQEETGTHSSFVELSADQVKENEHLDLPNPEFSVSSSLSNKPVDFALTSSTVILPTPPPLPPSGRTAVRPGDEKSPSDEQATKSGLKSMASNEKEDYLQQIRTKSFQLRPTATSKTQSQSGPAANLKVAAILEKAIAIRQACVGSDEGADEENWSDS